MLSSTSCIKPPSLYSYCFRFKKGNWQSQRFGNKTQPVKIVDEGTNKLIFSLTSRWRILPTRTRLLPLTLKSKSAMVVPPLILWLTPVGLSIIAGTIVVTTTIVTTIVIFTTIITITIVTITIVVALIIAIHNNYCCHLLIWDSCASLYRPLLI